MSSTPPSQQASIAFPGLATQSVLRVRPLAKEIRELRRQGEHSPIRVVLSRHPEIAQDKSLVVELANEYLCQASESGQPINVREFIDQFPNFQEAIRDMASVHGFFVDKEPLLEEFRQPDFPEVNTELAGFSLLRELGRGTFACVYLAAEPALGNRLVAVKVSQEETTEPEILGRLTHRNVVPIHSVKKDSATGFTVVCMPYLGSATLCNLIDRIHGAGGLPISADVILDASQDRVAAEYLEPHRQSPDAILKKGTYIDGLLHLGLQLAEALAFIHSLGICHCDLKPSNVLLTPDAQPMLLDFNLSFREQPADQRLGGTLPYMSPEFLRAMDPKRKGFPKQIDARSDLFSLGVMLCELLLGDHPFGPIEKKDTLEDLRKYLLKLQQKGARPKWSNNRRVDKKLSCLLNRCVAYRPEDRPQSASELVRGLRKCLSRPQRLKRWSYLHTRLLVATSTISLFTIFLASYWLTPSEPYSVRQFNKGMSLYHLGQYNEAIEYFNRVDRLDPKNSDVQFARGRTFQKMGQFDLAAHAYLTADQLRPEAKTKALLGYCSGQLADHDAAIAQNNAAIEDGLGTAEVFNNRGYSHLKLKHLENAENDLKQAIELDENLQAAHFNLALLELVRAFKNSENHSARDRGILEIDRALKTGPEHADLYYTKARLYARATAQDSTMRKSALDCLEKAFALGFPSHQIDMGGFQELAQEPRFKKLLSQSPSSQIEFTTMAALADPVRD